MAKNLNLFWILSLIICYGCKQPAKKAETVEHKDTTSQKSTLSTDTSIHHFLNTLINRSGIVYDTAVVEVRQADSWDEQNGHSFKEPYALTIAGKDYLLKNVHVAFGDEGTKETIYEVDTAMRFSFSGRSYIHITAGIYMCNGSGCGYVFHFLLDEQTQRLHMFEYFRGIGGSDDIIGDMNNDGRLDILVQEHLYTPEQPDTTDKQTTSFTPYTLNDKGYFEPVKNHHGAPSYIIATYTDQWQMNNFKIIGGNDLNICKSCY